MGKEQKEERKRKGLKAANEEHWAEYGQKEHEQRQHVVNKIGKERDARTRLRMRSKRNN